MNQMTDRKGTHTPPWDWEGYCSCGDYVRWNHKAKQYIHTTERKS